MPRIQTQGQRSRLGQIPISAVTRLVALLGQPVSHSGSPRVHNAAFRELGLNIAYMAFSVKPEELPAAVQGLRVLGAVGANVTIPHKEAIVPLLDRLSDRARLIGAVNTLYWEDGQLVGENTDGPGFCAALHEQGLSLEGRQVTILGSGGAAKAVAVAAVQQGARSVIMTHRQELAFHPQAQFANFAEWQEWVKHNQPNENGHLDNFFMRLLSVPPQMPFAVGFYPIASDQLAAALQQTDFLINATSLGMWPLVDAAPLSGAQLALLPATAIVADLVYNPPQTKFLRMVRRRGLRGINGLGMLVQQGALAFGLWTGREAPLEVMRRAVKATNRE